MQPDSMPAPRTPWAARTVLTSCGQTSARPPCFCGDQVSPAQAFSSALSQGRPCTVAGYKVQKNGFSSMRQTSETRAWRSRPPCPSDGTPGSCSLPNSCRCKLHIRRLTATPRPGPGSDQGCPLFQRDQGQAGRRDRSWVIQLVPLPSLPNAAFILKLN